MTDDKKPIDLRVVRSERTGEAKYDTVKEALETAVEDAEEFGWTKAVLLLYRDEPGGDSFYVDTRYAGCNVIESRGIMLSAIGDDAVQSGE